MQPFPQIIICQLWDDMDADCPEEHNPFPDYEDHHYGCECDGCIRWYQSLG